MHFITSCKTTPSGFNLQPTHAILLRNPSLKSTLSKHAMLGFGNKYRTIDASGISVFVTDLQPSRRIDRIYELERSSGVREDGYMAVLRVAATFLTGEATTVGGWSSTHLSTLLKQAFTTALSPVQPMPSIENVESWSYKNAGIMAQMYTMAATAHGLSTCMMEG
jgi:nitroreductase